MSPTVRLTAYRPLSRTGAGFAILIRRGRSLRFGAGISPWSIRQVDHMNLSRTSGVQLHPTSLPVRTARSGGLRVGRLARRGRPDVVADAAAGAARRARLAVQVGLRVRGFADAAGRSGRARHRRPSARLSASRPSDWIEDWIAFAGEAPWTTRSASTASGRALRGVRRRARREADRRHPDLRRARLRRRSAPTRRSSSAGVVAGVPPDAFTDKGQLWGNPVYDWPALRRPGYAWWIARFRRDLRALRPRADRPLPRLHGLLGGARRRRVRLGGLLEARPGRARRSTPPARRLGDLPLIAEDLGVITPPVTRLRESLGLPGMAVLQFGFTPSERHTQHVPGEPRRRTRSSTPARTTTTRSAAGTTALAAGVSGRWSTRRCGAYGIVEPEPHWALIRLAFASPARIAMIQLQDVLGLGPEGRMNQPGTVGGWGWKLDELPWMDLAARLRAATESGGAWRSRFRRAELRCGVRNGGHRGGRERRLRSRGANTASGLRVARPELACRSPSSYGPLTFRGAPRSSVGLLRISRKRTRAERGYARSVAHRETQRAYPLCSERGRDRARSTGRGAA